MKDLLLSEPGLFQDTVQRSRPQVHTGLARHGHCPRLAGMPELAVTASGADQLPAILFKPLDNFMDLQADSPSRGIVMPQL
jgi:hypothetical protein